MARVSLLARVVGVAFASLVLLLAAGADGALDARGDRITWRTHWSQANSSTPEEGWLQVNWTNDYYLDHEISHVQVVQLAPQAPVPPGLSRIPVPGEVFISPALRKLIESDPEVLGARYGDVVAGTITDEGLGGPDELVAISGYTAEQVPSQGLFYRELPGGFQQSGITLFMRIVVILGVVVLLFPIALFIAAAARLNAQESDARLAAFRLAGADPRRVRWIVAWESVIAAVPGMLLGLGLFFAVRPLVAQVEFDGTTFFPTDFELGWPSLLVSLLVPVVVVGASFVGLRDVEISPLGVSRRVSRRAVRPAGLLLLVPGLGLLWYVLGMQAGGVTQALGLVASMLLILLGVALIGTWLGQFVARICAVKARSGSALLAFRRITADPHGSFRTVSGVAFAVFAGTLFLSLSAALEREVETDPLSGFRPNVIWVNLTVDELPPLGPLPEGAVALPMRQLSGLLDDGTYVNVQQADCDALAKVVPMEGGCNGRIAVRRDSGLEPGDSFLIDFMEPPVRVAIPADAQVYEGDFAGGWAPDVVLPPGTVANFNEYAAGPLAVAPPEGVALGDREFELLRTALIRAYPMAMVNSAREYDASAVSGLTTMKNLVYAGTFAAFTLSGATAAITVAGSILARRRSFALLRMSGVSLGALRRTVMTEATLPLTLVSAVSAVTAVGVSAMMIWRVGQGSVLPPPAFALPLLAGLALGLLLPLMTIPLLGAVTRLEQTRFE